MFLFQSLSYGCYPGRVLIDANCELLLPVAENLKYVLTFLVDVKVNSENHPATWTLALRDSAKSQMQAYFGKDIISFFFLPIDWLEDQSTYFSCYLHMEVIYVHAYVRNVVENNFTKISESLHFSGIIFNHTSYEIKGIKLVTTKHAIERALNVKENLFLDEHNRFLEHARINYESTIAAINMIHVSSLLFCRHQILSDNFGKVFVFSTFQITHISSELSYGIGEFVLHFNGRVGVCEGKPLLNLLSQHLKLMTIVFNCCSMFFLFFLFLTYMVFRTLQTLPGLILMNVVISLFFTQLIFTISNLLEVRTSACIIFGVLLHYFWLTLSCSQFTCCLHMCRVFGLFSTSQLGFSMKTFYNYVVFTHSVPVLLVGLSIVANIYRNNNIGYGMTVCFVEDTYSNLLTFIIPVATSCLVNIVLYVSTVCTIICRKHIQKSKEDTSYIIISLKLFSVTGGVFVFTIIDAFLHLSVFSFITSMITSLQGVFIFISFFTSHHVLSLFKKQWKRNNTNSSLKPNSSTAN